MSATIPVLDRKNVSAHFDLTENILVVSYRGVLDATVAGNLHDWIDQMQTVIGARPLRGLVFDLRKVLRFKRDSIFSSREQSDELQNRLGNQVFPIALLVSTYYQEQMAQVTLLTATDADRRKIVYSMDDAFQMIRQWSAGPAHI